MVRPPWRRLTAAAPWNGQPPQSTTGVASTRETHCQAGNCSAGTMASTTTGTVCAAETTRRKRSGSRRVGAGVGSKFGTGGSTSRDRGSDSTTSRTAPDAGATGAASEATAGSVDGATAMTAPGASPAGRAPIATGIGVRATCCASPDSAGGAASGAASPHRTRAAKPADRTASTSSATSTFDANRTRARSVARFTRACTPSIRPRRFSTRATQLAHVMPSMSRSTVRSSCCSDIRASSPPAFEASSIPRGGIWCKRGILNR